MTLHCASRIGFLSSIYQKRHKIAHTLGLISEVPIAMCNSDYDFNPGLVVLEDADSDSTLPPITFQTQEILLFFHQSTDFLTNPNRFISLVDNHSKVIDHAYKTPALSIFHPPS